MPGASFGFAATIDTKVSRRHSRLNQKNVFNFILIHRERNDLRHTVEVMADLGLSYSQSKSLDGTYQYQLEPDINELCNFKGNFKMSRNAFNDLKINLFSSVVGRSNELTYSNMQIIAREVELEVMRRSAPRQHAADNQKNALNVQSRILQSSNKPNHLQRLVSKPIAGAKVKETVNIHLSLWHTLTILHIHIQNVIFRYFPIEIHVVTSLLVIRA